MRACLAAAAAAASATRETGSIWKRARAPAAWLLRLQLRLGGAFERKDGRDRRQRLREVRRQPVASVHAPVLERLVQSNAHACERGLRRAVGEFELQPPAHAPRVLARACPALGDAFAG